MHSQILKFYLSLGLVFSGFRLLNFVLYRNLSYSKLSLWETLLNFAHGIRFDLSIIFTFCGLPSLLLMIPLSRAKYWQLIQRMAFITLYLVASLCVLLLSADLMYFRQVRRHIFDELITLVGEWDFISATLFQSYGLWFGLYLGLAALGAYFFIKKIALPYQSRHRWPHLLGFVILSVFFIRGGFVLKPIGVVNAYSWGGFQGGQLAMNGVFSAWHASRDTDKEDYPSLDNQNLQDLMQQLELNPEHPFEQRFTTTNFATDSKPNIMIVLLESWAAKYTGSFGYPGFGATPNFDKIAKQGIRFTNFYASGSRSVEALQAILTSFPSLKGIPTLGRGFELMQTAQLGALARAQGYNTSFMQSAPRESFHLGSVAKAYGFEQYFGMEDFKTRRHHQGPRPAFGWDYEMLMHAGEHFSSLDKPFLSFLFTGTTHSPFVKIPERKFAKNHGPENHNGFLNSLDYADWALGKFFSFAKTQKWFDNTIFILTADHTLQTFIDFDFLEGFHIPLVLYAPKFFKPQVREDFGGHLDILPTVVDLIGSRQTQTLAGRSLLHPYKYRYAFLSQRYSNPAWIDSSGYLVGSLRGKNLDSKLHKDCDHQCQQKMQRNIATMNAFLYQAIRHNSWAVR